MNRSILIVICDFLLVSLLAFSTVDINKVTDDSVQRTVKVDIATRPADNGKDLAAVMRIALEDERQNRDRLLGELTRSRQAMSQREQQVRAVQEQLQARDQEALRLQQQQTNLLRQFAAAQANIQSLHQQLQNSTTETLMSKEKLAAMEAETRKQSQQAAALQQSLADLGKSNQVVLTEKQQLASKLQVAEVEQRHAAEQAARMSEEVKIEREEKAKLAEGVKVLASKSGQLAEEIRENRLLTPNAIFNEFVTNQLQARFDAFKAGTFDNLKHKDAQTVLVTDGTNTFALCHVEDTPLTLWKPGTEWEALTGTLNSSTGQVAIQSLSFAWPDPRVVWMQVTGAEARQLGCKVYRTSADPFKFQDAVLVGAQEGYYGECRFEIDLTTPDYVKLDHSVLKGLFGKFNPSRGDLVFSKTGELLGVMVNNTYCMITRSFDAGATFRFGNDVREQHTSVVLAQLYSQLTQFPSKLQ